MNKKELVEKINSLDALTVEEKSALIDLLKQKKYGLVWENKPEDVEERLRAELPVLKEVKDKALLDGGDYAPNHILIEGDNLEALTALTYTHENKIDVIYIDPPYNTGNKDFVYNDSFVDSEDGYRHSKWLSFMDKRLRIAKRLLSDRGVIFISIDDNEQANLKLLCDELFGESNFITSIPRKGTGGRQDSKYYAIVHEYALVYAKQLDKLVVGRVPKDDDTFKLFDAEKNNFYKTQLLRKWGDNSRRQDRPNLYYPIYFSPQTNTLNIIRQDEADIEIFPMLDKEKEGCWRWGKNTMQQGFDDGVVEVQYSKKKDEYIPYERIYKPLEQGTKPFNTWIDDIDNSTGSALLKEIMGTDTFGYPKPVDYIKRLQKMSNANNDYTILDFFAGSGTTLHATMQLNAEDGGHRKCILVTNNENNICEEVTYERNKRVINGYTTPKGEQVEGLKANNLRYYQIDHVERESSLTAKRKLMAASAELLCIKHDIYEESTTFGTLKLKPHIARYFTNGDKQMLIIYMVEAIERIVEEIETMPEDTNIMVYVFSTNNYAMDADFEDVADKVTLCALPAAIYNAYLKVLPKKGEPKQIIEEEF